jgi:ribonuclease E
VFEAAPVGETVAPVEAAVAAEPEAEPAFAEPTIFTPEPVAELKAEAEAAPVAPAAGVAPAAAIAPAPVADLNELLGSAGLVMASTDPEKLRAAQEAAAQVAPPPRKPRERKPLPPQVDEPLIQVDTRQ